MCGLSMKDQSNRQNKLTTLDRRPKLEEGPGKVRTYIHFAVSVAIFRSEHSYETDMKPVSEMQVIYVIGKLLGRTYL